VERNRRETALRCLEIAVHPNTSDEEALAAVRGFRRTVGKTPLVELCQEFASAPGHLLGRLDQLNRANLELQRRIEAADADRIAAMQNLKAAERRWRETDEELRAAERRAEAAEEQLTTFQGAYGRISGGLRGENDDLRRALDEARRNMAQPIHEPVRPFQNALNAALQRSDTPSSAPVAAHNRPWTA